MEDNFEDLEKQALPEKNEENTQNSQEREEETSLVEEGEKIQAAVHIDDLYKTWFLQYASYVILERAVPALWDGLKPVQRRILHSMKEMDDGRFHKVANIIGQTMQYHPHGDAAIGDALVNIGQKELLIETQGNWGDVCTGDKAAAPRYIEARLSKFALAVSFHEEITEWQVSYDGRKQEPIHLPVKFPLVLAQGTEGIAVGLATKIMPHNFHELIDASIEILKGNSSNILPDFPTGGMADFSNYNGGEKGGRIRVRGEIEISDKKTLLVKSIPYGTTTGGIIESIVKANDNGKIKIKKVIDNTAREVEIEVQLPSGVSPDVTIDALYAFTNCEVSISPNCCVIADDKPQFLSVDEMLMRSTFHTQELLRQELAVKLKKLQEKWFFASLEKIFIEKRIYRKIEECTSWEQVVAVIQKGIEPFLPKLHRDVNEDDITRLTEIRIKRITKYNAEKARDQLIALEGEITEVQHDQAHLGEYSIAYFNTLKEKFGRGRERKTEIRAFDTIQATEVVVANQKLYVNRKDGFVGYGLKKDELIGECSDLDDIILFFKNGHFKVTRISDKAFVGKDILYLAVWRKNDERMVYNMMYRDNVSGRSFAKRFSVTAITRDKEYDLTKGAENSKLLYFTANPNGETEKVMVYLSPQCNARKKELEFDFAEIAIKGRSSQGNTVTKHPAKRVAQKSQGESSFGGLDIWYDESVGRINTEKRGQLLGSFVGEDAILTISSAGVCQLTSYELSNRFEPEKLIAIQKYQPETIVSVVYYSGEKENYFVKRFNLEGQAQGKELPFLGDHPQSRLVFLSTATRPRIKLCYQKKRPPEQVEEIVDLSEFMGVKGWQALGNRLCFHDVVSIEALEDLPEENTGDEVKSEADPDAETSENVSHDPEETVEPKASTATEPEESKGEILAEKTEVSSTKPEPVKQEQEPKKDKREEEQLSLWS